MPLVFSLAISSQVATAGIVVSYPPRTVAFQAFSGEANDITLTVQTRVVDGEEEEFYFAEVTVTDSANAVTPGAGCAAVNANTASCRVPFGAAFGVEVYAVLQLADMADESSIAYAECDGADEQPSCHFTVNGGDGRDTLAVAPGLFDSEVLLAGGPGNDELTGTEDGDVALEGGPGADTLRHGIASYRERMSSVLVTLNGERDDGEPGEMDLAGAGVSGVAGGSGDDVLVGNSSVNYFDPGAGDDAVRAGGGSDRVFGCVGAASEDGTDRFYGGDGPDWLDGCTGADLIRGGSGNDTLYGGSGRDRLYGDRGRDWVKGDAGGDALFGGRGPDVVTGQIGRDLLSGGPGLDDLRGGADNDVFHARDGYADTLRGGLGRDRARIDRGLDLRASIERLF